MLMRRRCLTLITIALALVALAAPDAIAQRVDGAGVRVNGISTGTSTSTDISLVCDGVFNNTSTLQALLTTGGNFRITNEGTCLTGALAVSHSFTTIAGISTATILKYNGSAADFISVGANDVTFRNLTIDPAGATTHGVTHSAGLSRITYDNANIITSGTTTAKCGFFQSDSYVTVMNSRWANCVSEQFYYQANTGTASSAIRIVDSVLDGTSATAGGLAAGAGIVCSGTGTVSGIVVAGNTILFPNRATSSETDGLYISCSTADSITRIAITGNVIQGDTADSASKSTSSHALELAGVTDATVSGNFIGEAAVGVLFENQSSATGKASFTGNVVRTATARAGSSAGFNLTGSAQCEVVGNQVQGPWFYQINAASVGCTIGHNVLIIENGGSRGIFINAASQIIEGNYIQSYANTNGTGIDLQTAGAVSTLVAHNYVTRSGVCINLSQASATNTVVRENYCTDIGTTVYAVSPSMAGLFITDPPGSTRQLAIPTSTGCSATIGTGSTQFGGTYASGTTGTCTIVITLNQTAPTGWACSGTDINTSATQFQTATSTTTCTLAGATTSGNTITYLAYPY